MQASAGRRVASLSLLALSCLSAAASRPASAASAWKTGTIQISSGGDEVWTANQEMGSVSRVATGTRTVTELRIAGCQPGGVSLSPDAAELWITCPASDEVVVVETSSFAVVSRIPVGTGSGPAFIALSPDGTRALVTLHRGDAIALIDTAARGRVQHLPSWRAPLGAAWSRDGRSAWITHAFSDGERTHVTRLDVPASRPPSIGARVPIEPQFPQQSTVLPSEPLDYAEGGAVTLRGHLAEAPTGGFWIPAQHSGIADRSPTMNSTIQAAIHRLAPVTATIPAARRIVLTAVHAHDPGGAEGWVRPGWDARVAGLVDIAFTPDGEEAWLVAENSENVIRVPVDAEPWKDDESQSLAVIPVGRQPSGIVISPDGSEGYVLNSLSRALTVLDLRSRTVEDTLPLTPGSADPLTEQIKLGRRIFHTSTLPQVSGNGKVSCASCHFNAEHDGLIWQFQNLATPLGPRPTTSMLGLSLTFGPRDARTGLGQLHRAGDRDEIQDFEHTFRDAQMGGRGFFVAPPNPYGGNPNGGQDASVDAMAAYMLSLPSPERSPHRAPDGGLTPAAMRGAAMFRASGASRADAACGSCHSPARGFADRLFHDVGSARDISQERQISVRTPRWEVNTPTLIGTWTTAPFDDAGSAGEQLQDLAAVLAGFDDREPGLPEHGRVGQLSRRQVADLAEFVLSIDRMMTPEEVAAATDGIAPRLMRVEPVSLTRIDCWFDETVLPEAGNPINWRVVADDGTIVPVLGAAWDPEWGDKVTLTTDPMPRDCRGRRITVIPGRIFDAAGSTSVGSGNALDLTDPSNIHEFTLGDTLTVTFGASGRENVSLLPHDAAFVGPSDPGASLDEPWMKRLGGSLSTRGFLRFPWDDAFRSVTGLTSSADIVDANFTLEAEWGGAQAVIARRMLQAWTDRRAGDFESLAPGVPTWLEHGRGQGAWNAPGGLAMGGTGRTAGDYYGAYDVAATTDATGVAAALGERVVFGGPNVTDAYRLWFDEPVLNMGHALELAGGTASELRFARSGGADPGTGAVLSITYRLPPAADPAAEVSPDGSDRPLLVTRSGAGSGLTLSFADDAAGSDHEIFEGTIGAFESHAGGGCEAPVASGTRRLSVAHAPASGDRYFLVATSGPCGGMLGLDSTGSMRATRLSACMP